MLRGAERSARDREVQNKNKPDPRAIFTPSVIVARKGDFVVVFVRPLVAFSHFWDLCVRVCVFHVPWRGPLCVHDAVCVHSFYDHPPKFHCESRVFLWNLSPFLSAHTKSLTCVILRLFEMRSILLFLDPVVQVYLPHIVHTHTHPLGLVLLVGLTNPQQPAYCAIETNPTQVARDPCASSSTYHSYTIHLTGRRICWSW